MSVKKFFRPRELGGIFIEADYAQLEIHVLALATGDKQLIQDINDGIDLHRKFASQIFKKAEQDISEEERKMAKGFSFQLQYGAGAKSISEFWGVDIALVKSFIKAYYSRYPTVKDWQDNNIAKVKALGAFTGQTKEGDGHVQSVKSAHVESIWPQDWGNFHIDQVIYDGTNSPVFPGTQIKNFPIQGGAADIMLLMLGHLASGLLVDRADTLKVVNTVHDSVLFEFLPYYDEDETEQVRQMGLLIKRTLEEVPAIIYATYGIHSPILFPVDVTSGHTWGEQEPIDF